MPRQSASDSDATPVPQTGTTVPSELRVGLCVHVFTSLEVLVASEAGRERWKVAKDKSGCGGG